MDIRKFAVEDTGALELVSASDEPLIGDDGQPMTIVLYGPGSKQYAKAQAGQTNRMLDKLKRKGKSDQSAEEKIREQAEFLASCTKSFSANIAYDELQGEALHRAVYAETGVGFIAEQVGKYLGDWSNFTTRSTTS